MPSFLLQLRAFKDVKQRLVSFSSHPDVTFVLLWSFKALHWTTSGCWFVNPFWLLFSWVKSDRYLMFRVMPAGVLTVHLWAPSAALHQHSVRRCRQTGIFILLHCFIYICVPTLLEWDLYVSKQQSAVCSPDRSHDHSEDLCFLSPWAFGTKYLDLINTIF